MALNESMKQEYDFSDAEQGKFHRTLSELDVPIYLDDDVKEYFLKLLSDKKNTSSINEIINSLLKKDIEISNKLLVL